MKSLNRILIVLILFFIATASVLAQDTQANFKIIPNLAYGDNPLQKIDVYVPNNAKNAPVLFMVHGGGWANGDKTNPNVVKNKVMYWLGRGFIFVSVNYRMLPVDPVTQAKDVAKALAYVQTTLPRWGGDPNKIILMGHSAGAHLVGLLSADPSIATAQGTKTWKASVLLDSAAFDVEFIMQHRHFGLYDSAFGTDEKFWQQASPFYQLKKNAPPMLLVCSSKRMISCPQAENFSDKAKTLGVSTQITRQDLTHEQINETLGLQSDYTKTVDGFITAQLAR